MSLFLDSGPAEAPDAQEPESPAVYGPTRRIPNLAHAFLFVSFAVLLLIVFQAILLIPGVSPGTTQAGAITIQHPKLQLATLAATYLTTLFTAWVFYPLVWNRTFLDGLQWRWSAARSQAPKLIGLGLLLGAMAQGATYFISSPKSAPIDEFFLTPSTAWLTTLFGTLLAPVFEEICFRGFLAPAFAIAYDWLSLPRTDYAHSRWQSTTTLSPLAFLFSAVVTSLLFALMHADQDAHVWAILLVLFGVSLVLTFVRVKTQSVAASALVHATYNGLVFVTILIASGGFRHLDRLSR